MLRKHTIFKANEEPKPVYQISQDCQDKKLSYEVTLDLPTINRDFDLLEEKFAKGRVNNCGFNIINSHRFSVDVKHVDKFNAEGDKEFRTILGIASRYYLTSFDLSAILDKYSKYLDDKGFSAPKSEKNAQQEEENHYTYRP